MNTLELKQKCSHRVIFIGSARGVNRFYVTNKFIEAFPDAKVINTGAAIHQLCKEINIKDLDTVTLSAYYSLIEPILIEKILSHLEHTDVILDTHFHYILPCLSVRSLNKFRGKISEAAVILVEEEAINILNQKKDRDISWFSMIENVREDILANEIYYKFYKDFFTNCSKIKSLSINLKRDSLGTITGFIKELKNE